MIIPKSQLFLLVFGGNLQVGKIYGNAMGQEQAKQMWITTK